MRARVNDVELQVLNFIADVARSTTIEDLQSRYLEGVGEFVAGFARGIYILNPYTHGAESLAARGVSDYFLVRYEETGRSADPVLERVLAESRTVDNQQLMTTDAWTALPVYETVFSLHRMMNLLEAPLLEPDGTTIGTLNFGRTDREGAFTAHDHALVETIARLLSVTVCAIRARGSLERERDRVVAALELCSEAVVVTDLGRAERRMNRAARGVLARIQDDEAALDELMASRPRKPRTTRQEIEVSLTDGRNARLVGRSTSATADTSILVSFLQLCGVSEESSGLDSYGLTAREQDVARLAASGLHDAEIAEQLFISPYTVKQYLRAAYGKVGVRSRVDLTRVALERHAGSDT